MNWKFWEKASASESASKTNGRKPGRPREVDLVGRYLVQKLKQDPDWAWTLKEVVQQRGAVKSARDFRVFDPVTAKASNIIVKDYATLDAHPELILYEGWYDKNAKKVMELTEKTVKPAAS